MLVGINGPKGCGKSTLRTAIFNYINSSGCSKQDISATTNPLAEPLKLVCKELFGGTAWWGNDELKSAATSDIIQTLFGPRFGTYRRIMQYLGTEVFRKIDPSFWVKLHQIRTQEYDSASTVVLVDDVRFENEASYVRNCGVLLILKRRGYGFNKEHASEEPLATNDDDVIVDVVDNQDYRELAKTIVEKQIIPYLA